MKAFSARRLQLRKPIADGGTTPALGASDARSDAVWISGNVDETVVRLNAYAEAGADMVFPTMLPPPQLKQIRPRAHTPGDGPRLARSHPCR